MATADRRAGHAAPAKKDEDPRALYYAAIAAKAPKRSRASTGRKLLTAAESKDRDPVRDLMAAARALLPEVPRTDGPLDFEFVVSFPAPIDVRTSNKLNEEAETHWSARSKYRKVWRDAAREAVWAVREQLAPLAGCPISVTVSIPRATHGWIDEHGLVDTLVKPCVDAIVDTGVLIPDDHTKPGEYTWVVVEQPIARYGAGDVLIGIRHAQPDRWDPAA